MKKYRSRAWSDPLLLRLSRRPLPAGAVCEDSTFAGLNGALMEPQACPSCPGTLMEEVDSPAWLWQCSVCGDVWQWHGKVVPDVASDPDKPTVRPIEVVSRHGVNDRQRKQTACS